MSAKNYSLRLLAAASAIAVAVSVLVILAATQPVEAAFQGTNGRIVFERDPDGFRGPKDPEILTIWFDGNNLRPLTNNTTQDTQPSWSADGKRIVYSGGDGRAWDSYKADIFVMKANGSDKTRITDEAKIPGARAADDLQPAFSPGGRQIVFVRNGRLPEGYLSNNDIYKIGIDGNNLKRLVDIPSFEYHSGCCPAWSPDGSKIAFYSEVESDYSIETIRADGTGRKFITYGFTPNWSPDGSQIVFVGPGGIYKMNANGTGEPQQLTTNYGHVSDPAFSPSGTRIVFSSDLDGDYDLYITKADGTGTPRQLTNGPGDDHSPDWQPVQ